MKGSSSAMNPRAEELLVERALRPLDDNEHRELAAMGVEDDESFDMAAAAIAMAVVPIEPMPQHLIERILASAAAGTGTGLTAGAIRTLPGVVVSSVTQNVDVPRDTLVGVDLATFAPQDSVQIQDIELPHPSGTHEMPTAVDPPPVVRFTDPGAASVVPGPAPPAILTPLPFTGVPAFSGAPARPEMAARPSGEVLDLAARRARQEPRQRSTLLPWLAAAAGLLVAGGAVWWSLSRDLGEGPVATTIETPEHGRAALVAGASDLTKISWTATQDPTAHGTSGDVVWSESQQRGYMRFVGLAQNDRALFQYQLWIFDKTRDDKFPVDGGVFDVTSTGEVIIPITAKLHVNEVALFAVTVEKPGGVVVSKRERIVVTAARS